MVFIVADLRGLSGPDLVFGEQTMLQSVVYQSKTQKSETVPFCGANVRVWKPDSAIDDSTSEFLDGGLAFDGMLTEIKNLDRVGAGRPLKHDEAVALANKFGVKNIVCRWVTNAKIIDDKPGVRSRIVVKDIAQGAGKAKSLGISSPTPSTESLKMAVAVGGHANSYVTTLDCSAAFMHTPLGKERKVIVKLPVSISWEDLSPVYVDLERSLNGLRSASLDWLSLFRGL